MLRLINLGIYVVVAGAVVVVAGTTTKGLVIGLLAGATVTAITSVLLRRSYLDRQDSDNRS